MPRFGLVRALGIGVGLELEILDKAVEALLIQLSEMGLVLGASRTCGLGYLS